MACQSEAQRFLAPVRTRFCVDARRSARRRTGKKISGVPISALRQYVTAPLALAGRCGGVACSGVCAGRFRCQAYPFLRGFSCPCRVADAHRRKNRARKAPVRTRFCGRRRGSIGASAADPGCQITACVPVSAWQARSLQGSRGPPGCPGLGAGVPVSASTACATFALRIGDAQPGEAARLSVQARARAPPR